MMGVKYLELACDMPVRWNSTDKMLTTALKMEKPIRAVLLNQEWDPSVRANLTPTDEDWALLKEMSVFFDIFRRPTVQSQADKYPTLHNTIPDYLHILRQLNVWQLQNQQPSLKNAAKASHKILLEYYKKSLETRHSFVATICDPRYKLNLLEYIYDANGGTNSTAYKKAKSHFEHVWGQYNRRAIQMKERERVRAEEAAIDAASISPEPGVEGQEQWRVNPHYGYTEFLNAQRIQPIALADTEVQRWYREPVLPSSTTPEQLRSFLQSRAYDFPIITQMARDYLAIPATSAPSERVFSEAGNLISKKRPKIASSTLRYVLCLRHWGLIADEDPEEVIVINEDTWKVVEPPDIEVEQAGRTDEVMEQDAIDLE